MHHIYHIGCDMTTGWLEKKSVVSDWLTVVPVGYLLSQGELNTKNKTKTIPTCFQRYNFYFKREMTAISVQCYTFHNSLQL